MENLGLTKKQKEWLDAWGRKRSPKKTGYWRYRPATGLVDVIGNFNCASPEFSSFKGVRFGKVSGYFNCQYYGLYYNPPSQLTSLEGAPQEVGGYFLCRNNSLTSLEGAPQEVGGDFDCGQNPLTSLAGAPQEVSGKFICDAFELKEGEWNPKGWLKVLKEGRPKAQKLILTILSAEALNKEIQKDPARMIMSLKEVWNDENFKEIRAKIVLPKIYQDDMDLVGDMSDVGF